MGDKLNIKQSNVLKIILLCIMSNIVMFIACILAFSMVYPCVNQQYPLFANERTQLMLNNNKVIYDFKQKSIIVYGNKNQTILTGTFGNKIEFEKDYKQISINQISNDNNNYEIKFLPKSRAATIEFQAKKSNENDFITCNTFEWNIKNTIKNYAIQDFEECFNLDSFYWFGQAESYLQQYWPINNVSYGQKYTPYLTGQFEPNSAVLERYWLASSGIAIIVDQAVPLFVLKNITKVCFLASGKLPYDDRSVVLKYDICSIDSESSRVDYLNKLHLYVINNYFSKPINLPDLRMLRSPIWSTWAVFKRKINHNTVLKFAQEIIENNYTNSQLEIDDK
jgi:hypothetical protein